MGFVKTLIKVLMPALAAFGFLSTLKFARDNGFFNHIEQKLDESSPRLPESPYRLRTHWTGFTPADKLFTSIVIFFYPCIDGLTPNLTLQSVHFMGQLTATWILLLVESFRVGNYWKWVSFITIWGLGFENIAAAFVLPIYFSIHLLTSPTGLSPSTASTEVRKTSLLVHPIELKVIPWAVILGLGAPLAMISMSYPGIQQPWMQSQQFWIVVRNFHPIFTSALILLLSMVTRPAEAVFQSAEARNRNVLRALQNIHAFAILVAAVPHIATVTLVLSSRFNPAILARKYQALFDPYLLFEPKVFWAETVPKVSNISGGVTSFLQWDEAVTSVAVLLWAWAMNREATSTDPTASGFFSTFTKTFGMILIGGPAAAAVFLIAEKDQVILDRLEESESEKS